jgi:hypothetical protein
MDDWMDEDEDFFDQTMREPSAKRMKRSRNGEPMVVEVEAEKVKQAFRQLRVDDEGSDDDSLSKNEADMESGSAETRDVRRMEMNSAKKVKERARRGKMADSVRALRILVPACIDEKKVNQSQVLANTVAYITKMQAQYSSLQREIENLKSQLSSAKSDELIEPSGSSRISPLQNVRQSSTSAGSRQRGQQTSKTAFSASPPAITASPRSVSTASPRPIIKLSSSGINGRVTTTQRAGFRGNQQPSYPTDSPSPAPSPFVSKAIPVALLPYSSHSPAAQQTTQSEPLDTLGTFVPMFTPMTRSSGPSQMDSRDNDISLLAESPTTSASGTFSSLFSMQEANIGPHFSSPSQTAMRNNFSDSSGHEFAPQVGGMGNYDSSSMMHTSSPIHATHPINANTYDIEDDQVYMDDIEEVGRWPLYHTHDPSSGAPMVLPYEWGTQSASDTSSTQPNTAYTVEHVHQIENFAPGGSAVCECGKRPVF